MTTKELIAALRNNTNINNEDIEGWGFYRNADEDNQEGEDAFTDWKETVARIIDLLEKKVK